MAVWAWPSMPYSGSAPGVVRGKAKEADEGLRQHVPSHPLESSINNEGSCSLVSSGHPLQMDVCNERPSL